MLLASTFMLLIINQISRIWWPDLTLYGHFVHSYFRFGAWITTGLAVIFYIRFKRMK